MLFDIMVALRFLREGKGQTVLIMVGIGVGIAVQIFLSSLITGLQKNLIEKTVGTSPHVTASQPDRVPLSLLRDSAGVAVAASVAGTDAADRPLRNVEPALREVTAFPGVTAATGTADGAAFVFQGDKSVPIVVRGLDRESADPIYRITPRIVRGSAGLGGQAVAIGTTLAAKLRLQPGSPMRISLAGGASEVFTVAGIFDFEVEQLNESWVIMSRQRSAALFGYDGGVTSIEIQVRDVFAANRLAQRLRSNFPEFKWSSWMESNASLLAALQSQSSSSLMIQVMVIIAVALGISSVLAVSAVQKVRQIGILKALGSTTASISRIFLIQGGLLGLAGALLGCGIGAGLAYGFIYGTSMATGRPLFPLQITAGTYLTSMLIATGVGTVAAMAPARRSARLNPIEVIRNG